MADKSRHSWHGAYTLAGSRPPESAGAGAGLHAPGKVQIFTDRSGSQQWMDHFDEFFKKKGVAVTINDKRYTKQQFIDSFVIPAGKLVRHGIDVIRDLNTGSIAEIDHYGKDKLQLAQKFVDHSVTENKMAGSCLDSGHYGKAYYHFDRARIYAGQAREAISVYNNKVIADADRLVTASTIVRNGSFAALSVMAPGGGIRFLIIFAEAAAHAGEEYALNGHVNWKKETFSMVLDLLGAKYATEFRRAVGSPVERWVVKELQKVSDSKITRKVAFWVLDHIVAGLKDYGKDKMKEIFNEHKDKPAVTYKQMFDEFIKNYEDPDYLAKKFGPDLVKKGWLAVSKHATK